MAGFLLISTFLSRILSRRVFGAPLSQNAIYKIAWDGFRSHRTRYFDHNFFRKFRIALSTER